MYDPRITSASLNALGQLVMTLQEYREDIVLVGGWAPYFILQGQSFKHGGSRDIDFVLRKDVLRQNQHVNIREKFNSLDYQTITDAKFYKNLTPTRAMSLDPIRVDLLCDIKGESCNPGDACQVAAGIKAHAFDGMSIAFDFNCEQSIEFKLDDGVSQSATFEVVDLVGSLVLKSNSFFNRPIGSEDVEEKKDKDAFDMFAVTHYNGGARHAAEYVNQALNVTTRENREFIIKSLANIRRIFMDAGQEGPIHANNYEPEYKKETIVGQMKLFFKEIETEIPD